MEKLITSWTLENRSLDNWRLETKGYNLVALMTEAWGLRDLETEHWTHEIRNEAWQLGHFGDRVWDTCRVLLRHGGLDHFMDNGELGCGLDIRRHGDIAWWEEGRHVNLVCLFGCNT